MLLKTLVLLLLVCFSYSKAEEKDTGNILTPADEWTLYDDASTTQCSYSGQLEDGEVCTGNGIKVALLLVVVELPVKNTPY